MAPAGRPVLRTAALHGGAVRVSIGGVEVTEVHILDLGHIVTISVFPSLSMSQLTWPTRVSEAAESLTRLESFTRSKVEDLVISTEGRSELLITSTPMSQPTLITVTAHRAISQIQSLAQSADSVIIYVTALTLVHHLFG